MKLLFTLLLVTATLTAQEPPPTGVVHTPQVDLAYWVLGKPTGKTPVMAINGGPGLSHIYMMQNDLWQRVARTRQVILYDQRGTGRSTRVAPDAPFGMDAQVADLDAVRAHLHLAQVDLVGDSYGGLLSMAYTAAHPDHVRRLVLSDSPSPSWSGIVNVFPQVFPDVMASLSKPADPDHPTAAEADRSMRDHFRMLFYSPENRDRYLAHAKDLGVAPGVGARVHKATSGLDLTSAVSRFTQPTLVITGRYDMNVTPIVAWRLAHEIPHATFEVFERSGHLPAYEEPAKYLQVLTRFLDTP